MKRPVALPQALDRNKLAELNQGYVRPKPCQLPGCSRSTREHKPYCTDHVEHHEYVQGVIARLEAQERELAAVKKRGPRAVDPAGLTAQEIVLQLELYGDRTSQRLSRDLRLEEDVVQSYARALARKGFVTLSKTSRGVMLLELPEAEQPSRRIRRLSGESASNAA